MKTKSVVIMSLPRHSYLLQAYVNLSILDAGLKTKKLVKIQ